MFFRLKKSGPRSYLQIVENRRDGRSVRQHVIATIGRIDELAARGGLATLLASGARFCEQVMLLSALDDPEQAARLSCKRIGGPLLFGHLWERLGIADVLRERLAPRAFEFALERAVFVATLHRLFVSGSDRDCASWMQDYAIPGTESLSLHHFYRAMAWLGEELPEERQDHATPFSPRTIKDEIEEALFARHRDLFTNLSVVFMDTTSLSFEGEGGETLGAYGYSKDHRPDLKQMILAVMVDGEGRPICTEMMPGNTADVSVLVPGQPSSRESPMVPDADAVTKAEGHTSEGASASPRSIRRGQRPWHARTLLAREPGDLPPDHRPSGRLVRIGKARSRSR